ncbi:MAG: glycosyltransferase family 1 protein [Candidatus Kerfeldbacteria bacterium]
MKIGIDARFYGGEQSKGLGRYTQKLIEYLAEYDHDNEYVVFLQEDSFKNWKISNPKFTPVLAPYHWYTFKEQVFMPLKIWRAGVDFMHFPHFNVPLMYRKPFIATIHDLIIIHFPTERATTLGPLLYKFKHWAGKMVMRHAVRNSQQIITVSEFSKQDIVRYYDIPGEKVTVTYEAADAPRQDEDVSDDESVLAGYSIKKPYVLYVGNAYPHKNLETLLDVAKMLNDTYDQVPWKFVLVGKMDHFYKRLKQDAWAKNVDDNVLFTEFVPDKELPALYRNALAYIFPSRYEGFGLPPLEAMSYGAPVLAAKSSCLHEILGDAALYFHPEDVSGIINAIKTVSDNPSTRQELINKGFLQVKKYSWSDMARQTLNLYEQLGKHKENNTSEQAKG